MKSEPRCDSSLTSSAIYTNRCMPGSLRIAAATALTFALTAGRRTCTRCGILVELEEGTPSEVAARIDKAVTDDDLQRWQSGTPEQWTLESLAVVRTRVYRLPTFGAITANTRNQHAL